MTSPDNKNPDNVLHEKIEELESLIDGEAANKPAEKIKVPVLDELVTEADFINGEDEHDVEKIEEQIVELAEKLESKFSGELDQLVRLLKDNLKNNIVEELRSQANLDEDNSDLKNDSDDDADTGLDKDSSEGS